MFGEQIEANIEATEKYGAFDVLMNKELIFNKFQAGRLPLPGEVEEAVFERLSKG